MGCTHDQTLDRGCSISRVPVVDRDCHKRTLVRVSTPMIPGVFKPYFHYDCLHNQIRSIVGRVAGPVVSPSKKGVNALMAMAKKLGRSLPMTGAAPLEDMPARYSGNKRRRYEWALEALVSFGLFVKDSYCKMFIKADRMNGDEKRNPDPRAIQFRNAKYCVALASYLHPIEHYLYHTSFASKGVPPTRNIAKGLNSVQRAELLKTKLAAFRSPRVLSLDASRFDKHVSLELLQVEHSVYLTSNPHPEFRKLLAMQLKSKIFSSTGICYKVRGRRMSGDMNTAAGNCVLMILMIATFADAIDLRVWDCVDDGDDVLLIVESEDVDIVVERLAKDFLEFGMEMKVEAPVASIHEVEFCQSRVVEYAPDRFKFVRDYRKVISKALCGIRHWQDPHYRRKVLRAIGSCELVLNLSVPVLQAFAIAIIRNVGRGAGLLDYAPDGLRSRALRDARSLDIDLDACEPRPIMDCARVSFEQAFGLSVVEQLQLEADLDAWTFSVDELYHWGDEWSVEDWLPFYSRVEDAPLQAKCLTNP